MVTTALARTAFAAPDLAPPRAEGVGLLEAMQDNIWQARCWRDLDGWVNAIRLAFEQGKVDAFGVEWLMQQAIRVSRLIPESYSN